MKSREKAFNMLLPKQYNNLIELTYRAGDNLVNPPGFLPGQRALVIAGKEVFSTILTGWEKENEVCKLVFGNVRLDLTKKLILERRKNNVFEA